MQTYWDLSAKERSELTEQDMDRYVDIELMSKGVLKVQPLELLPEDIEEPEKRVYFVVHDLAFETLEAAHAFIRLNPHKIDHKYYGGQWSYDARVDVAEPISRTEPEQKMLVPEAVYVERRARIDKLGELRAENKKRRDAHEKQSSEQKKALEQLWSDWHARRAESMQMRRVIDTFEEYKRVAGDAEIAARFLLKVFDRETIANAAEWCGVAMPLPPEEAAAE